MMGLGYFFKKINISNICHLNEKVANIGNMIDNGLYEKVILLPFSLSQILKPLTGVHSKFYQSQNRKHFYLAVL